MIPTRHSVRICGGSQTRVQDYPKGIVASSPRVASNACLGCVFGNGNNANGVVADVVPAAGTGLASTVLRLWRFVGR